MPGRLSDSQIAGKHPSGVDRWACRANPLGHPAGAHAGRTFCDPRTSCGDTNGSTLHVAKQVRGIQNPQSCRQAHRKSHLSGAPFLASIPAERIAFRPVRIIAGEQIVVHYDEGSCSLSLSEPRCNPSGTAYGTGSVAGVAATWRSVLQKLNYFLRK